jgi:hypothetical protein
VAAQRIVTADTAGFFPLLARSTNAVGTTWGDGTVLLRARRLLYFAAYSRKYKAEADAAGRGGVGAVDGKKGVNQRPLLPGEQYRGWQTA